MSEFDRHAPEECKQQDHRSGEIQPTLLQSEETARIWAGCEGEVSAEEVRPLGLFLYSKILGDTNTFVMSHVYESLGVFDVLPFDWDDESKPFPLPTITGHHYLEQFAKVYGLDLDSLSLWVDAASRETAVRTSPLFQASNWDEYAEAASRVAADGLQASIADHELILGGAHDKLGDSLHHHPHDV